MVKRVIIDVDIDDEHVLEGAGYEAEVTRGHIAAESLDQLLSVLENVTTEDHEDALPEEGISVVHGLWALLAVVCFFTGLMIGLLLYFRSKCVLSTFVISDELKW